MFTIKLCVILYLTLGGFNTQADEGTYQQNTPIVYGDDLLDRALIKYESYGGASLARYQIYVWSQLPYEKNRYIFLADLMNERGRVTHNQVLVSLKNGDIEDVLVTPIITPKSA